MTRTLTTDIEQTEQTIKITTVWRIKPLFGTTERALEHVDAIVQDCSTIINDKKNVFEVDQGRIGKRYCRDIGVVSIQGKTKIHAKTLRLLRRIKKFLEERGFKVSNPSSKGAKATLSKKLRFIEVEEQIEVLLHHLVPSLGFEVFNFGLTFYYGSATQALQHRFCNT